MTQLKKKCKLLFDLIIYFLISILALYLCLVLYQKKINKSELITFKNYYIFQIASSSMENNLHVGDYIVVLKTNDYKVGDIITFKVDGVYITHRIYQINNDEIITKGDANDSVDDSINKDNILGKVLFKATILSFLVKHKFLLIIVIIILFIIDELLKKDKKELLNENNNIEN